MQPGPILQAEIPDAQRQAAVARLPSMLPVAAGALLTVDDAYAAQLAEKARLIAAGRERVIAALPGAEAALAETLDHVLADLCRRPNSRWRRRRCAGPMARPSPSTAPTRS